MWHLIMCNVLRTGKTHLRVVAYTKELNWRD